MEDEKIVSLYLDRDERAIRMTSEKYGSRLRALSFGITADRRTAEECENDTYLQAWNRIPPNEPSTYLYAFLARITRHISIDRCRERDSLKRGGILAALDGETALCLPSPEDTESLAAAETLGSAVSRYLHTLSKEKRVMFVRRYFYLDSVSAIGKRCGVSESKVKTTLFRVRAELREYLKKEGYTV